MKKILAGVAIAVILFFSFRVAMADTEKEKNKDMVIYVVSPMTSFKILPTDTFIPGEISDELRIIACCGEYEPGSFVISASSDINSLKPEPTELKSEENIIPSSSVDIKVVKCWWYEEGAGMALIPGPLLYDDTLIKVDYTEKNNYLKLSFPQGDKYVWLNDPKSVKEGATILSGVEYPIKDSPNLLPVNIPVKENKQFLVTLKVPEDAKPGAYSGKINLSTPEGIIGSITLKLKVLPFELSKPYYEPALFYCGSIHSDYAKDIIYSHWKSEKQFRAEMRNLVAHGVTNCTVYQGFDEELLGKVLKIRNEVGMGGKPLYYLGWKWSFPPPEEIKKIPDGIKKVIEFAKGYGVPDVYFFGKDEARGEELKSQRPEWEAIHQAGGKVFVAGYEGSNFPLVGDIQDLLNCAGYPSKEEAERWHSVGHRIWSYGNPQAGEQNPEVYRRNYGLLLWKCNYDGPATWAYQNSAVTTVRNLWGIFRGSQNFTYPTLDGVIDTIAWEGYREAIDDVRYVTTLSKEIDKVRKSEDRKIMGIVAEAEKYLETLDVESRDLDTIRLEVIKYILKLRGELK